MRDYVFGNFLCSLREKKGYTQAYVAKVLDVTPAAVSKWENGESKPRVDVLFKLANLLDVRAEELIEGRYIEKETLDELAVRAISERYEYLRRVDSFQKTSVKIKRILAFIIDWNIFGLIVIILLSIEMLISKQNGLFESSDTIQPFAFIPMITILAYFVAIVFRDFIFNGRSLGKRIFGLVILDVKTATKPKLSKTILRDLFFFLYEIDGVVLLVSGKSIGDYVAHTVVVDKSDIGRDFNSLEPAYKCESDKKLCGEKADVETLKKINSYSRKKSNIKLYIAIVIIGFCMLFALIFSVLMFLLDMAKDTQGYDVAYDYFVNSEVFDEKGYSEDKVRFVKHKKYVYTNADDYRVESVLYGFRVRFRDYSVVVHPDENGNPFVCDRCTSFE